MECVCVMCVCGGAIKQRAILAVGHFVPWKGAACKFCLSRVSFGPRRAREGSSSQRPEFLHHPVPVLCDSGCIHTWVQGMGLGTPEEGRKPGADQGPISRNVAKENRAGLLGEKPRQPGTCPTVLWVLRAPRRGPAGEGRNRSLCPPRPLSASVSATPAK